jgi:hypothetical protein
MTCRVSRAEARAFRERWRRANAREIEELRTLPMEVRLQQFNTMLAWAQQLGWSEALAGGEADVRARWARLRKTCRG